MVHHAAAVRPTVARLRALLAASLILGLLLSVSFAGTVQAATTINVGVGVGSGTVSGNTYLPGDLTILVGDSLKWTIESDEPHSVTFGNGPAGVPPDEWPVTGLTGTVPPPPGVANLTGTYGGTGFLNTGLLWPDSTATVQFTAAGSLSVHLRHPSGHVRNGQRRRFRNDDDPGRGRRQGDADAQCDEWRGRRSPGGRGSRRHRDRAVGRDEPVEHLHGRRGRRSGRSPVAAPASSSSCGSSRRPSRSRQGDTVKWTAPSVHTVTFLAAGTDPSSVNPFTTPPAGGSTYDGTSLYHSGLLGIPAPGSPNTYELTFPDAGIVQLHLLAAHLPRTDRRDRGGRGTGGHATGHGCGRLDRGATERGAAVARDRVADGAGRRPRWRNVGAPPPLIPARTIGRVDVSSARPFHVRRQVSRR